MTTAGPWSVKGIDPKAREIAKDLARRSGMTLGDWLNHMIIEGEDEGPQAESPPYDRAWLDQSRTRPQAASFSATESLRARLQRELGREAPPPIRDYGQRDVGLGHNSEAGELQRIGKLLADLSARIESSEHRATLQISGIDQQVMGVLGRVESAEREQVAAAARFDVALDDVRAGQGKLNDRLRRFDGDESARLEAVKSLEGALTKVAGQIYEGESRSRVQLAELREDVSALARRVDRTDSGSGEAAEKRLEALTVELTRKMDEVRTEATARLKDASDGKLDRMEAAIHEIVAKVSESEKRSGEAVDRVGREVMRVAQSMSTRVQAVETRSAAASEQMGSEMTRIAEAMEGRMRRADAAQAEALEKLGGEISRIAENLADRMAASERRSAGAMTHVGDQIASVTDTLNRRSDATAADLAERITASEDRTAKLLAETRESIDRRLAETRHRLAESEPVARDPSPIEPPAAAIPSATARPQDVALEPVERHEAFDDNFDGPGAFQPPPSNAFADFPPEQAFLTDPAYAPSAITPFAAPEPQGRPSNTRDLIASARAAARAASETRGRRSATSVDPFEDTAFGSSDFNPSYETGFGAAEFSAPEAPAAEKARGGLGFGFALPRKKKKDGPTLKTLLMASAVAATLSVTAVGAVGLVALDSKSGRKDPQAPSAAPDPHAALAALERSATDPIPAPATPSTVTATDSPTDRLAMAVSPDTAPDTANVAPEPVVSTRKPATATPTRSAPAALSSSVSAAPAAAPRTLYSAAVRQIESGDPSGVDTLRKAANLGYPAAEFYLAKLFESGGGGLHKDMGEARRWTTRAAQAGDAKAMHNLALYWYEGDGGPKDPAQAADWFRRAADLGVGDSQYNLGRMYEEGYGVSKNAAESYKWYSVAAASGDPSAKAKAEEVKHELAPEAQAGAERAAASVRAQIAAGQLRTASSE